LREKVQEKKKHRSWKRKLLAGSPPEKGTILQNYKRKEKAPEKRSGLRGGNRSAPGGGRYKGNSKWKKRGNLRKPIIFRLGEGALTRGWYLLKEGRSSGVSRTTRKNVTAQEDRGLLERGKFREGY